MGGYWVAQGRCINHLDDVAPGGQMLIDGWEPTAGRVPSPEDVEAARTPAGGFTSKQLAEWGVAWPPPSGWRKALADAYRRQQEAS